ncbi:hypothetical protein OsI_20255 [Oryza sativa Indica Group]|uniref:Uncharacterized protein n=1 Tax=Oryza sativa subsp. indica TaxID=39946 RepID=B8AZ13_ORYSI|nr:hypothetical protein OsI_20255 [Oryza sativa Indica Group]
MTGDGAGGRGPGARSPPPISVPLLHCWLQAGAPERLSGGIGSPTEEQPRPSRFVSRGQGRGWDSSSTAAGADAALAPVADSQGRVWDSSPGGHGNLASMVLASCSLVSCCLHGRPREPRMSCSWLASPSRRAPIVSPHANRVRKKMNAVWLTGRVQP